MSERPGVWKRRRPMGKNPGGDISHYFPDLQKYRTPAICQRYKAARSDLADEIKGITQRCMRCEARLSGIGLLIGLRKAYHD